MALKVFIVCRARVNGELTRDFEIASHLKDMMANLGMRAFVDEIPSAEHDLPENAMLINNTIMKADVMLVVCSDARYVKGGYVAWQWRTFLQERPDAKLAVYVTQNVAREELPRELTGRFIMTEGPGSEEYICDRIAKLDPGYSENNIPRYKQPRNMDDRRAGSDGMPQTDRPAQGEPRLRVRPSGEAPKPDKPVSKRRHFPFWAKLIVAAALVLVALFVITGGTNAPDADEYKKAELAAAAADLAASQTISVEIPKGVTLKYIAGKIEKAVTDKGGKFDADVFLELCKTGETLGDYSFVSDVMALEDADKRPYCLEGYIFAGTYDILMTGSEEDVLRSMLDRTSDALESSAVTNAKADSTLSIDDAVTLASMLQFETGEDYYAKTAAVYINRITAGMMLSQDQTLRYALGKDNDAVLTDEEKATDSPYNTGLYAGLPAGPVATIDVKLLTAALAPDATGISSGYLYFMETAVDGDYDFCKTYEEYVAKVAEYQTARAQAQSDAAAPQ